MIATGDFEKLQIYLMYKSIHVSDPEFMSLHVHVCTYLKLHIEAGLGLYEIVITSVLRSMFLVLKLFYSGHDLLEQTADRFNSESPYT